MVKNINPVEVEMKLDGFSGAIKEAGVFMHKRRAPPVILPDYNFFVRNGIDNIRKYFRDVVISPFNAGMSSYKRIMQFTLVNSELPRTRLSKLQRFKFEELLVQKENEKTTSDEPDTKEYHAIKSFIESAGRHGYSARPSPGIRHFDGLAEQIKPDRLH